MISAPITAPCCPCLTPIPPRACALTATADAHTAADITTHFAIPEDGRIIGGDRPNIHYAAVRRRATLGDALAQLRKVLAQNPGPGIIYARTRAEVEQTADALSGTGRVLPYPRASPRTTPRPSATLFDSPSAVMVATIAFGMGVDKPDMRFIVHLAALVGGGLSEAVRAAMEPALAFPVVGGQGSERRPHRAIASGNERGQEGRWRAMGVSSAWGCRRACCCAISGASAPHLWSLRPLRALACRRLLRSVGRILTRSA
jgi:ATP-dependent DNA helicase RecQ